MVINSNIALGVLIQHKVDYIDTLGHIYKTCARTI
jgi:hypothetical protein